MAAAIEQAQAKLCLDRLHAAGERRLGHAEPVGSPAIMTPQGKDGASYRNYAVTFAFLDWLFGTLHIPSGRPWRYGIPGAQPHWAEEVFYPLVRIGANNERSVKTQAGEQDERPAAA